MGSWYYIVDGEFAAYALKIYITLERIDEELRPYSLQCRRIFGAGALNNPSLLSSWARKRKRAGASQKVTLREKTTG